MTTAADGTATSTELYLGKYEIVETKAPYGMVLNEEPISVELKYAGQEVAVTSTSVSIYNERQKAPCGTIRIGTQMEPWRRKNHDSGESLVQSI